MGNGSTNRFALGSPLGRGEDCTNHSECEGKCKGARGVDMKCRERLLDCKGSGYHNFDRNWRCSKGMACTATGIANASDGTADHSKKWGECTGTPTASPTSAPTGVPTSAPTGAPSSSTITAGAYDFEDGTLQGWEILPICRSPADRPSYGNTPQFKGTYDIHDNSGFSGNYMIRSQNPGFGNDITKGILESPEFSMCSTTTIRYLYGGGDHCRTIDIANPDCNSGIVQINLEVRKNGQWIQKDFDCYGGGTRLTERSWTVSDEGGNLARIRAYDLNSGGWGHNLLDNVRIECTTD